MITSELRKLLCLLLITLWSIRRSALQPLRRRHVAFNNIEAEIKRRYGFDVTDSWPEECFSLRCFNNGASGSFVSPEGLVMTNHHVASDTLQKLSVAGKDHYQMVFMRGLVMKNLKLPTLNLMSCGDRDVTARVNGAVKRIRRLPEPAMRVKPRLLP